MDIVGGYGSDEAEKEVATEVAAENAPAQQDEPAVVAEVAGVYAGVRPISTMVVRAAPDVQVLGDGKGSAVAMVSNTSKIVQYNPTFEQLWAPEAGPLNPYYANGVTPGMRNTLGGSMERTNLADFHFEEQYQTFNTFGFAMDPSAASDAKASTDVVGDSEMWHTMNGRSVFQATKRDAKKRKMTDAAAEKVLKGQGIELTEEEVDALGKDMEAAAEVDKAKDEEKKASKKKAEGLSECSTAFHGKEKTDYQGRTWVDAPSENKEGDGASYIPKQCVHTWTGHTKGVHSIKWFPKTGHLLLSASMDGKVKIWDVYNSRKCMRTYMGHTKPVRDICFSEDGRQIVSCGYDKAVRYWDTETGQEIQSWKAKGVPFCCKIHPGDDNILVGCSNKNLLQWDPRIKEEESLVQEYIQHLGSVNTCTFIDNNRRIVTTSDDKKLFVWEYGIGTAPMKHVAEPWMHSMPAVTAAPSDNGNPKYLLCQSLDNQILVYATGDRFKLNKKKLFTGHVSAGYACQVGISPDMKYVISGDGDGRLWLWDWKSSKVYRKLKAHDGVCIGAIWHPMEPSKIATCGWDGLIKFWD